MYILVLCALLCSRGAVESIRALGGGEPGKRFSNEAVQRLMAACDTLRECASGFIKLGYKDHAAETHAEYAHGLRSVRPEPLQTSITLQISKPSYMPYANTMFTLLGCMEVALTVTSYFYTTITPETQWASCKNTS